MPYRTLTALLVLFVLAFSATGFSAEASYVQTQNIVYGEEDGVGLLMDVFVPTGAKNGRGIVDVISSAWHSDRKRVGDHEKAQIFSILCSKGFTVFAVRPGSIGRFTAPEMLKHVHQGIGWVKQHAGEYGVDPNQLGLTGASAGGHLASLAMVTADKDTQVKAVAVFFPPTDFLDFGGLKLDRTAVGDIGELAGTLAFGAGRTEGKTAEERTAAFKAISPAELVKPGLPPYLTIHGDADPLVPLQQSQRMVEQLKAQGNSAELIVKPGGAHPWPTLPEEVAVLADWFVKQLVSK